MDSFERRYLRGKGKVYFRDKFAVPSHLLPVAVVGGVAMGTMGYAQLGLRGIPFALLGGVLFVFGNLALSGMRVVVSDAGLEIFIGARRHHYPLREIAAIERGMFSLRRFPFGRGHVKWGPAGRAFLGSMRSINTEGVELTLRRGARVLVSTNDVQGLIDALHEAGAGGKGASSAPRIDAQSVVGPSHRPEEQVTNESQHSSSRVHSAP